MTVQGCDYAFSSPDPAGLYEAGLRFAMRYVGPGTDDKHLHAGERDALWAAGLAINLLAEAAANSALGGFGEGQREAQSALTAAEWLGAPSSIPIYFAVDFDVTSAQWPAVASYLRGAGSVIGPERVGIYGGIRAMQWAARDGAAAWFFQTYAWSGGQWYPGNHVEQYDNGVQLAGGVVDLCRAVQDNYGQWEAPDMTDEQWMLIRDGLGRIEALINETDVTWTEAPSVGQPNKLKDHLAEIDARLTAIEAALPGGGGVGPHTHEGGMTGPVSP